MGTVIEFLTVCHWYVAGSRPSWARALRTSLTWLGGEWTLRWKPSSSLWDKSPGTLSTCCPWQTSPCRFLDRPGQSRWGHRGIQRVSSPLGNPQHHPTKLVWEVIFWKHNSEFPSSIHTELLKPALKWTAPRDGRLSGSRSLPSFPDSSDEKILSFFAWAEASLVNTSAWTRWRKTNVAVSRIFSG